MKYLTYWKPVLIRYSRIPKRGKDDLGDDIKKSLFTLIFTIKDYNSIIIHSMNDYKEKFNKTSNNCKNKNSNAKKFE